VEYARIVISLGSVVGKVLLARSSGGVHHRPRYCRSSPVGSGSSPAVSLGAPGPPALALELAPRYRDVDIVCTWVIAAVLLWDMSSQTWARRLLLLLLVMIVCAVVVVAIVVGVEIADWLIDGLVVLFFAPDGMADGTTD
jgi:hypothetical protein